MKLIKKIKSLIRLKKALRGCEIVHKVDENGKDKIIPYMKFLTDDGIKLLTETWELFGGTYLEDSMSGEQAYYCMLIELPFKKYLTKDNVVESFILR